MPTLVTPYRNYGDSEFANAVTAARAKFASDIAAIVGAANLRVLFVPKAGDTTTTTDLSLNARTITQGVSAAGRLSQAGFGQLETWDGSTNYATINDAADLSFGNGTVDSPFSVSALINVTDTAAIRELITKFSAGQTEYLFRVEADDTLSFKLEDTSAAAEPIRQSTGAVTQGAVHLFGATYTAATGGATAANDITLYQDGVVKASTATNAGTYVAMENGTQKVTFGGRGGGANNPLSGSLYMMLLCAGALTLAQHLAIKLACNNFYGLSL